MFFLMILLRGLKRNYPNGLEKKSVIRVRRSHQNCKTAEVGLLVSPADGAATVIHWTMSWSRAHQLMDAAQDIRTSTIVDIQTLPQTESSFAPGRPELLALAGQVV
jgi:hypothetical protein